MELIKNSMLCKHHKVSSLILGYPFLEQLYINPLVIKLRYLSSPTSAKLIYLPHKNNGMTFFFLKYLCSSKFNDKTLKTKVKQQQSKFFLVYSLHYTGDK